MDISCSVNCKLETPTKMNRILAYTPVVTLIAAFFIHVNTLDYDSAYEGPCFDVKTVPIDAEWALSQKVWYYPLMSRYDLYHSSSDFLKYKDPKNIQADEVYYESCMTLRFIGGQLKITAHGNTLNYNISPIKGMEKLYWEVDVEGDRYMKGTAHTTLTDNSTYFFVPSCLASDDMTWAVMSIYKELPPETTKLLLDHAESLGFKREQFTTFRYDFCKERPDGDFEPTRDEL